VDLRDKGASSAAQAARVALGVFRSPAVLLFALLLASCASKPPPPAASHSAPARDIVLRTGRFAIHANAYVAYYASALSTGAMSATGATDTGVGVDARVDDAFVVRLGACSDDPSARAALGSSPFAAGLDAYLKDRWSDDADDAQRSVATADGAVLTFEDLVAPALASQIGRVWPSDPIDVYVARASGVDSSGRSGPLLDTQGECFVGGALLECLLTRAVEVLLPGSELGRGIDEARARLDEAGRAKSDGALACVAALSVDAAVSAAVRAYQPTRRFAEACPARLRGWLADTWAKRMKGDVEAKAFGTGLVEEMAR
jgi:hypothetical protein